MGKEPKREAGGGMLVERVVAIMRKNINDEVGRRGENTKPRFVSHNLTAYLQVAA